MVNEWADPYYYRPPDDTPRPGNESVSPVVQATTPALLRTRDRAHGH